MDIIHKVESRTAEIRYRPGTSLGPITLTDSRSGSRASLGPVTLTVGVVLGPVWGLSH